MGFAQIEDMSAEIADFGEDADLQQAITDQSRGEHGLVTDYTSMVVVCEEVFDTLGIKRQNQQRLQNPENQAQQQRAPQRPSQRADQSSPMFSPPAEPWRRWRRRFHRCVPARAFTTLISTCCAREVITRNTKHFPSVLSRAASDFAREPGVAARWRQPDDGGTAGGTAELTRPRSVPCASAGICGLASGRSCSTRAHTNRRNPGRTDQRVDLPPVTRYICP